MVRRELRGSGARWTLVAALGVACAGRSLEHVDQGGNGASGGSGGTTGGQGSAGGTAGKGGGAPRGTGGTGATGATGSVGGSIGAGGTRTSGGAAGLRGDVGGSGPSPTSGRGGGARAGVGGDGGTGNVVGEGGAGNVAGTLAGWGGDAGAPGNQYPCLSPEIWSSNAIQCADGFIHRPSAGSCALPARDGGGAGAPGAEGGAGGATPSGCSTDADCYPRQYCVRDLTQPARDANVCADTCEVDADCGRFSLCLCRQALRADGATVELGTCVSAGCAVDSDCEPGFLCRADPAQPPWRGFACQTPYDQCGSVGYCDYPDFFCASQDGSYVCTL